MESRVRGDWGGIVLNGQAPINSGAKAQGEGGSGRSPTVIRHEAIHALLEAAGRDLDPNHRTGAFEHCEVATDRW